MPLLISRSLLLVSLCSGPAVADRSAAAETQPLPRSSPEAQGIPSAALLDYIDAADHQIETMNSFMLVRHGCVVAEGWWAPYSADAPHMLYSLSKSFTSTAVGLAIAEGRLHLEDRVLSVFPEYSPADPGENLRQMRLLDLLRMSTGHEAGVIDDFPYTAPDAVQRFLALPVAFKPGTHFVYNTPGTFIQSAIVQRVTGQSVLDYLRPRLFEPLGIENPTWEAGPTGISMGGFGLNIRTEDIAKFGLLYLQKGRWNGRQLVPAAWVEAATALQTANGSNPDSDWDQGYGYQFWRCRHGLYRGDGAFGKFCIVMPEQDAVVAITSGVRDMQAVMNLVWEKILPAFQPAPLPADRTTEQALRQRLAGLSVPRPEGEAITPLASQFLGRVYHFPKNDLGIESLTITNEGESTTLTAHLSDGHDESVLLPASGWRRGHTALGSRLDPRGEPLGDLKCATSGAWTAPDTYTARIVFYETPYFVTLELGFGGDLLVLDAEYNVSFGDTRLPTVVGRAAAHAAATDS